MPAPLSWKKIAVAAAKFGLSFAILAWLFAPLLKGDELSEIINKEKHWNWLGLAFVLCLMAHLISFYRWKILVEALDIPFSTRDAIRIGLIGHVFGLVAFGVVGGDSLRVYYATRRARKRFGDVICSVFADRAIGMLTMFSFATLGFLLFGARLGDATLVRLCCWLISLVTMAGWCVMFAFVWSPQILGSRFVTRLMHLPKIGSLIHQLIEAILLYRRRTPTLLYCIVLSLVVNVCFVATVFLIGGGINVPHPILFDHVMIAPMSMSANAVPLPGGMGGMEAMLVAFYDALLVSESARQHGVIVAFSFRFMLLILCVFGAIAWFLNRRQIESIVHEQEVRSGVLADGEPVGS